MPAPTANITGCNLSLLYILSALDFSTFNILPQSAVSSYFSTGLDMREVPDPGAGTDLHIVIDNTRRMNIKIAH